MHITTRKHASVLLSALALVACTNGGQSQSDNNIESAIAETKAQIDLARLCAVQFQTDPTQENLKKLSAINENLVFIYNESELTPAQHAEALRTQLIVDSVRTSIHDIIDNGVPNIITKVIEKTDYLMDKGAESFPVYARKGDKLYYTVNLANAGTIKIFNIDSKQLLKTYAQKTSVDDCITINNSAIYLVEVTPNKTQYADICISQSVKEIERIGVIEKVNESQVEATKGEFRSIAVKGVAMKNLFEEPKKITLRSQLKAVFSGSSIALVALQVPAGASDVMYSLRISTNEDDRSKDGKFYDNMCLSYNKVKFFNMPLYESQTGSGLLATLLGDNMPLREEDAYINMYVFYDAATAKKFQDGTTASQLKYDVDCSTLGTQSCNGRIPSKGKKTIYLAFENERMRYSNYIWLEAVSAVPNTEYYKTQYSIAK